MMAIADIYDALTAPDRPYKRGLPPERALSILEAEANGGKIDDSLFRVFVESNAWRLSDGS
jgi:3',5'-cyclic-nucleotide phosphodiesterase